MNAFEFLETDHQRIEKQLGEFIAGYDLLSKPVKFGRASLIFGEIQKHFEREESLLSKPSHEKDADQAFNDECLRDRKNIVDAMDNLLMSHVDDSDFSDGLRALLEPFEAHLRHYADKLFVRFRQRLSPQELRTMDSQATNWMLGSG